MVNWRIAGVALATVLAAACGEGAEGGPSDADGSVAAASAATTIDTEHFHTVLPVGWEIVSDDMDDMGLMTIAEKGSGGKQGVYFKVEGHFEGDAEGSIARFAEEYGGTPPETLHLNGTDWVGTRYVYADMPQTLRIAARVGRKVTVTVAGDDYDTDPGVRAVLDALVLE